MTSPVHCSLPSGYNGVALADNPINKPSTTTHNTPEPPAIIKPPTTLRLAFGYSVHVSFCIERVKLDLPLLQAELTFIDLEIPAIAIQPGIRMEIQYTIRDERPATIQTILLHQLESVANAFIGFG